MAFRHEIRQEPVCGKLLWLTDGRTELACALDYGIRIMHLSCCGMENLLYVQPEDCSDGFITPEGWRLRGGHRLWAAPESAASTAPDNEPVSWELLEDGVKLTQKPDLQLRMQKSVTIRFREDGAVQVTHTLKNLAETCVQAAAWGVTTLKPGGKVILEYPRTASGEYNPKRVLSLWGVTSLADPRIRFEKDAVCACHTPIEDYFKMGIYSHTGKIRLENLQQQLEISVDVLPMQTQPDGGCNLEYFMNKRFQEMETLGQLITMKTGETASHTEYWRVCPAET